jgi:hypothetical protein
VGASGGHTDDCVSGPCLPASVIPSAAARAGHGPASALVRAMAGAHAGWTTPDRSWRGAAPSLPWLPVLYIPPQPRPRSAWEEGGPRRRRVRGTRRPWRQPRHHGVQAAGVAVAPVQEVGTEQKHGGTGKKVGHELVKKLSTTHFENHD